jgi:hypothetical protein
MVTLKTFILPSDRHHVNRAVKPWHFDIPKLKGVEKRHRRSRKSFQKPEEAALAYSKYISSIEEKTQIGPRAFTVSGALVRRMAFRVEEIEVEAEICDDNFTAGSIEYVDDHNVDTVTVASDEVLVADNPYVDDKEEEEEKENSEDEQEQIPPEDDEEEIVQVEVEESIEQADDREAIDSDIDYDAREWKDELIGSTVNIWWEGHDKWYTGTITEFSSAKHYQCHKVVYEDGDTNWHYLLDERWIPLKLSAAAASASASSRILSAAKSASFAWADKSKRKRVDSSAVSTELPTMDETAKANIGIMKIAHVGGRQYFTEIYILDKVLSLDDNEYYVVYPDELNAPKKMNISKKALKFVGDIPEDIKKKIDVPDWVFGKSSIH